MQFDKRYLFIMIILVIFISSVEAADVRTIPMDMNLIIDSSDSFKEVKNDAIAWLNSQVIDRILLDGDKITVWAAGDRAQVIYSDTLSASGGKKGLKDKLQTLNVGGKTADFSGALRELMPKVSQTAPERLAYTMLLTASAEGLEPTLTGSAQGLLRWFRSEKYSRWQVLIVAPDIGKKVQQSAAAYMASLR